MCWACWIGIRLAEQGSPLRSQIADMILRFSSDLWRSRLVADW